MTRNPFGDTPIGLIEPGDYADLLIMEGNPLGDTSVLTARVPTKCSC